MPSSDEIPAVFVTHAASVLADTNKGLSGSEIVRSCAAYAIDADVSIPFACYPFNSAMGTNKRTALFGNIMAFPSSLRFRIIKELCDHRSIQHCNAADANTLKLQLLSRYGHLSTEGSATDLSHALVQETRHWLSCFPKALVLYESARQKREHDVFERNVMDDLRLALEVLLHSLLNNHKSIENQTQPLGSFIKQHKGSPELANMFCKLFEYYSKYQNTYVKHDAAVIEEEVDFIFEVTSCFMRHLVRIASQT